ncbi:glycosyltransferase family 2 protein [Engelhardtia mirabilis]|uniref:N-acetylglucosaminyl-diphospho-decaprenol L-rhamnosyltransferase n=1 Tax=Engelhardtia mirabilis TaxID=2528011 RepID=A0A518BSM7_9BACT|nr:N-acetylglucosaminyl-diphospho-decaprenol L-rhamnosyltransferase [Planctomycetes bacterium Pla133]QDV04294.1 N-acetylglucosaminyl-diphospho-decaprenol L-rhamnosyltransferase [Planctomycetes bacterium Pla86]
MLSVLFVNYNSWAELEGALTSLAQQWPLDGGQRELEVVVVDNASPHRDASIEARVEASLARWGGRLVRHARNDGYGGGMNLALEHASGELILVCNPDLLFLPGCIERMARHLDEHPRVGVVSPETFATADRSLRLPTGVVPTLADFVGDTLAALSPRFAHRNSMRRTRQFLPVWSAGPDLEVEMVAGCCFMLRRAVIEEVGFFDERYTLYYEDTDLSLRVRRAGWTIEQVDGAGIVHLYDRSAATDRHAAHARMLHSRRAYFRRWYGPLGAWAHDACLALLRTGWAERRRSKAQDSAVPLGVAAGELSLEIPGPSRRWLVEIAYDPDFLYAAGQIGSGPCWTPCEQVLAELRQPAWLRIIDLDGARPRELVRYRWGVSPG